MRKVVQVHTDGVDTYKGEEGAEAASRHHKPAHIGGVAWGIEGHQDERPFPLEAAPVVPGIPDNLVQLPSP